MSFLPQPHGYAPCGLSISVRHAKSSEETRPMLRTITTIRDDSPLTVPLACSNLNRYHCEGSMPVKSNRTILRPAPVALHR